MLLFVGTLTFRLPAPVVNDSGTRRWFMLNVCVTDPILIRQIPEILWALGVEIVNFAP